MNEPHTLPDTLPDDETDAKWLTFKELADLRRISKDSAVSLVRRRGWRRQRDNEGHVRALVPLYAILDEPAKQPDDQGDIRLLAETFQASLDSLKAAQAEVVADLKARLASQETVLAEVKASNAKEVATLQAQLCALQADLASAREEKTTLETAEAAWNAQARWGRLRAAWRGTRHSCLEA